MTKLKKIPKFKNENEEANFWATHDTTDYFNVKKSVLNPVFPNLKLATRTITFRVTTGLLNALKMLANKKDVPYQSLMKIYLDEKVKEEFAGSYKSR